MSISHNDNRKDEPHSLATKSCTQSCTWYPASCCTVQRPRLLHNRSPPLSGITSLLQRIMSQAQQAPREYKFVGAFSRKRRRRNGHVLTTEPEYRVGAATSRRPTPPAKEPAITFSISTTSTTTDADIPPVLAPPVDDGPMTGGDVDWAFSRLMNPFLDAGPLFMGVPPFDQQFGPDMMPPLQLDDAPLSTNSSTDDYPDHESHDELVDDFVLAPIRPGAAPSNIPSTIAQLLSRCACVRPCHPSPSMPLTGKQTTGNFASCP